MHAALSDSDILRNVFVTFRDHAIDKSCDSSYRTFSSYVQPLQAVSTVCRAWRQEALPLLHETLELRVSAAPLDAEKAGSQHIFQDEAGHCVYTNLNTIDQAAWKLIRPHRVQIQIEKGTSIEAVAALVESLQQQLSAASTAMLTELWLFGHIYNGDSADSEVRARSHAAAGRIVSAIHAVAPGISKLDVRVSDDCREEIPMATVLGGLAESLTKLKVTANAPLNWDQVSLPKVKQLEVLCSDKQGEGIITASVPEMDPSELEVLKLYHVTMSHFYQQFRSSDSAKTVTFSKLRKLVLFFMSEDVTDISEITGRYDVKYEFPVLERLQITNTELDLSGLFQLFAHTPVHNIWMENWYGCEDNIDLTVFPNLAQVYINFRDYNTDDMDQLPNTIRNALEHCSELRSLRFDYVTNFEMTLPDTIASPYIELLQFDGYLSLSDITRLATELPLLEMVSVIMSYEDPEEVSLEQVQQLLESDNEPLSTSLTRLFTPSFGRSPLEDGKYTLKFAQYLKLLVRLPSLQTVTPPFGQEEIESRLDAVLPSGLDKSVGGHLRALEYY